MCIRDSTCADPLYRRSVRVSLGHVLRVPFLRVAWPATYKARYGEDYDPARFVCFEVRHQFDTPENQLVKHLVTQIEHCVQAVPPILRTGVCYFPAGRLRGPFFVADRLAGLETALSRFRRNVTMRSVTLPDQITEIATRLNVSEAEVVSSERQHVVEHLVIHEVAECFVADDAPAGVEHAVDDEACSATGLAARVEHPGAEGGGGRGIAPVHLRQLPEVADQGWRVLLHPGEDLALDLVEVAVRLR